MSEVPNEPFFIGWSGRLPAGLRAFYVSVTVCVVLIFAGLGLLMGRNIDDPGLNLFAQRASESIAKPELWVSNQKFTGSLSLLPYPVLHIVSGDGVSVLRSILLSGSGKSGVETTEATYQVSAVGGLLKRGDIDMLAVDELTVVNTKKATPPLPQPAGQWQSIGEICDGKCYPGGMTPGFGLAHRACATICLIGDVPAIFVVAEPIEGQSFLLLAGPDGEPPGPWIREMIARPVELTGMVERVGQMLVFKVDPKKARIL
jgi:hypothetical protein